MAKNKTPTTTTQKQENQSMYDDSKLYYIFRAEWLNGRPVWVKVIITAEEARHLYNQRVNNQRKQYANLLRA